MLISDPDSIEKEDIKRVVLPFNIPFNNETTEEIKRESSIPNTEEPERNFEDLQKLEGLPSPIEFLAFFEPVFNSGKETLHPWQIEVGELFGKVTPTSKHPFKYCLCAANGSGKDAFVIAPFALWFITTKIKSTVLITSSSGTQLTNQTERYIASLANYVNNWSAQTIGYPILKVNKRHITCRLSGSEIILFATDEENKSEGFHPVTPGAEFAIIVNEAKSVAPEIFRALGRCTGFNYWINVSTPGAPIGDFYKSFINWPNRKRVTFFDCPHQNKDEFDEDLKNLGEFSPYFRSKWLALFTYTDGKYVLSHERLEKLRTKIKLNLVDEFSSNFRVGLDIALSTNGDETVISIFKGNKQTKQITCRIKDATLLADFIEKSLLDNDIPRQNDFIWADDGGIGRAVIDILRKKKWNINRVLNQSAAKNKKQFRNRGAEIWSKFSRLVEEGIVILLDDDKLYSQLASRKYKESIAGIDKLCLQSKQEMIAEGINSPDRADAAVLAFSNIKVSEFLDEAIGNKVKEQKTDNKQMSAEEIEEMITWQGMKLQRRKRNGSAHMSLNVILQNEDTNYKRTKRKILV